MSFSISEFRSKGLGDGGARPNLFQASITGAPGFPADNAPGGFAFACKVAAIPASTVTAVDVPYFGRNVKVVGNRTFDNLSVTIINDEAMVIRTAIEKWMSDMNTHQGNKQVKLTPGASISIQHFAKSGTALDKPWVFEEIFPVSLGEIGLDWGSNDTIEEYPVEFAYDYWSHGANTN